jgi:nickel superoxide dismutase
MFRSLMSVAVLCAFASIASAHCQVPCGIFSDQLRFEQMLEDEHTISKAQLQINELSTDVDAQSVNQMARWVMTKEDHANKIQETIASSFMAPRIKTDDAAYGK